MKPITRRARWRANPPRLRRARTVRARRICLVDDAGKEMVTIGVEDGVAILRVGPSGPGVASVAVYASPPIDADPAFAAVSLIEDGTAAATWEISAAQRADT